MWMSVQNVKNKTKLLWDQISIKLIKSIYKLLLFVNFSETITLTVTED